MKTPTYRCPECGFDIPAVTINGVPTIRVHDSYGRPSITPDCCGSGRQATFIELGEVLNAPQENRTERAT